MPKHTTLRTLSAPRPSSRLALGIAALALTLPLAACDTGVDPRDPDSPTSTETSESASPSEDASALDPVGKWTSPEKGEPFLEFSEDGSVKGSDGCNAIVTTWQVKDDEIVVDSFMTTQKACAGVDPWLAKVSTVTIEGTVMKVKDSNGKVVGGLEREGK